MEEFIRQVPFFRSSVNDGAAAVSRLGEDIPVNRQPWSRVTTTAESTLAHQRLASLMAKGLRLPGASTDRQIKLPDGTKTTIEALGGQAERAYLRSVGKQYAAWLGSEDGRAALTLPQEQAQKLINRKDDVFKARATNELLTSRR